MLQANILRVRGRPFQRNLPARTGWSCWRECYDFTFWLGRRHGFREPDGDLLSSARVEDGEDHGVLLRGGYSAGTELHDVTGAAQWKSTHEIVLSGITIPAKNGRS